MIVPWDFHVSLLDHRTSSRERGYHWIGYQLFWEKTRGGGSVYDELIAHNELEQLLTKKNKLSN